MTNRTKIIAFEDEVGAQTEIPTAVSPSKPLPITPYDSTGININPATEDKQDDIVTELQKIAGLNYDTTSIDKSDSTNIVITYLLDGSLVATETISISGFIINIVKS